ncbi:hypothetical protein [Parabacteroides sp. PF5-9]|uniref:hypothetical protein n=1 Tax=Parabacteroides sp. PF5-9 TaxID=1742404 RepID=UPI002476BD67|nr:hypothetical protein [Parabacteroides sp. PF5-9]MDH6359121.1 hypothetical protein [Parabacteroides sp. PF5-9]
MKNYKILYSIAWTLIPVLILFANAEKGFLTNPLIVLGIVLWIALNVFWIAKDLKKSEEEEVEIRVKSEEALHVFSDTEEVMDEEVEALIKPINKEEKPETTKKGWSYIGNAFGYCDSMVFKKSAENENGVLFSYVFGNFKPTDLTILAQAFPLTETEDSEKILTHFLNKYARKTQTEYVKEQMIIKENQWVRYCFKSAVKKKYQIEILAVNKNNYLHLIVLESLVGEQIKQLKNFLKHNYMN